MSFRDDGTSTPLVKATPAELSTAEKIREFTINDLNKTLEITVDLPVPRLGIGLNDLAACDPKAGVAAVLMKNNTPSYFSVVRFNGQASMSVEVDVEATGIEKRATSFGDWANKIATAIAQSKNHNKDSRDFALIEIPALLQRCIWFKTDTGEQLVCLQHWLSDPAELRTARDASTVLALLKKQAETRVKTGPSALPPAPSNTDAKDNSDKQAPGSDTAGGGLPPTGGSAPK